MNEWYLYTILAFLFLGFQRFLYKVSAERGCDTPQTTLVFMVTVVFLAALFFLLSGTKIRDLRFLLIVSSVNGLFFLISTLSSIEALKRIPAGVAYPIIRLNTAVVVAFSIVYFKERPSSLQIAGILLALFAIVMLTFFDGERRSFAHYRKRTGYALAFMSLFSGSVASVSGKIAAQNTNILAFITLSYSVGAMLSLPLRKRFREEASGNHNGEALMIGCIMGLSNFAGFYSLMKAMEKGPLSIIVSLTGMYFVLAIVLSVIIYGERIRPLKIVGILLSMVAITLMRF